MSIMLDYNAEERAPGHVEEKKKKISHEQPNLKDDIYKRIDYPCIYTRYKYTYTFVYFESTCNRV